MQSIYIKKYDNLLNFNILYDNLLFHLLKKLELSRV